MADDKLTRRKLSPIVRVSVDEERIADSVRRNSAHCMIAEAMREVLPKHCDKISVDLYYAGFTDKSRNLRFVYQLPRNAQLALIDFDQGRVPEPLKFDLKRAAQIRRVRTKLEKPVREMSNLESAEFQRAKRERMRELREKRGALAKALNDPDAPLPGPFAVTENDNKSWPTQIGGRELPAAKNNFAKNRRFGLKMLAE